MTDKERLTDEEIRTILSDHSLWLASKGGKQAHLKGADLRWANLQGANLQGADLRWANLQGANLQSANLRGANLKGANLKDADLQGADLQGAIFRLANVKQWKLFIYTWTLTETHLYAGCLRFERDALDWGAIPLQGNELEEAKKVYEFFATEVLPNDK